MEAADEEPSQALPPSTAFQEAEEIAITDLLGEVYTPAKTYRMHYTIKEKRRVLLAIEGLSQRKAVQTQQIPRWAIDTWRKSKDNIFLFKGSEKTLSQAPRISEIIPFRGELIVFIERCTPAYPSLLTLLQRFAYRHGFTQRTPHGLQEKLEDLVEANYSSYSGSQDFNCGETGIYFDAPPGKILAEKGKSSVITAQQKHSARLTAVCTIRADGIKLPLLFMRPELFSLRNP
ncbi:hypothetical protein PHMEG_00029955 [Phytophthora megakarya]|uniref:Uncharacterized protein n=1 Tax=Phytophthora megakarya TaxID=4795 RepID=A0A225V295_9STRA|nr:hypothetical protein PHMEG_00029955 [Phytophthora megakarya]